MQSLYKTAMPYIMIDVMIHSAAHCSLLLCLLIKHLLIILYIIKHLLIIIYLHIY